MMKKKNLMVWSVVLVYLLMMIVSPLSAFAEESFEEIPEDYSASIAEEEQDYDEIGEPANTEFEEEWNLMQTDEEAYHELMEEKGYIYRSDDEKLQMIEDDPYGTAIDIGQIPDYYRPEEAEQESGGMSTYALIEDEYTDHFQTLNLDGKLASSRDFIKFVDHSDLLTEPEDEDFYGEDLVIENYGSLQGACYDGQNYYLCFLVKKYTKEGDSSAVTSTADVRIIKGTIETTTSGKEVFVASEKAIGLKNTLKHVNDMTYNRHTGELVIVCCEVDYHNEIYTISASDFDSNTKGSDFKRHLLPCMITAIDYNPTRTQYVGRLQGISDGFVILDSDFHVVSTIGYKTGGGGGWVTQGLCVDNLYIYSLSYLNNSINEEIENRLRIFNWDGELIKSFQFSINKNLGDNNANNDDTRIYESENILIANDRIMIGFGCMKSRKVRDFSYVDLSPWTYHLQFCPDEQVNSYKGKYNNGNETAVMFRDVATPLRKFRVSISGKQFLGWTAYRVETGEWLYCDSNRANSGWYLPANKPAGYVKYVYNDKQPVSRTGSPGGHVLMCAQWSNTDKFTVTFLNNKGSGTMTDQIVTHGTGAALKANTFTKENRSFVGWNAYWMEKNCWYYIDSDGTAKGWYKEGYEPRGYKKYTYSNGQTVKTTVHKGNHVYMYALWDEYYIQYALNQEESNNKNKMIVSAGILEMHTGRSASGVNNKIEKLIPYQHYAKNAYNGENESGYYPAKNQQLIGYNLYRKEVDSWRYIKDNEVKWFEFDTETSGYILYKKDASAESIYLNKPGNPGDHIILEAVWSDSSPKTKSCQRRGLNDE